MSLFSASLAGRRETTEPLKSTTSSAAVSTTVPPDSRTPTQSSSVKPSAIPPTTAQSERDTPTYFPVSTSLSTSSSLFDDDSQYSESHFLLGWQIGIIVPFAVVIFILFPWFIIRQLRRPRFRPSPGNVDLLAQERDLLAQERDLARRSRGRSGRRSHERGSRRGPARTLVDFLSFGSVHDNAHRASYLSGTTNLPDPPPAYNLHPTNQRVSAAPTYRSRSESLQPARRQTRVPATRLPALGLDGPEFDREQKSPDTLDRVDPEIPATTHISFPSTGGRTEKR